MNDLRRLVVEAIAEELEADCNAEVALDAALATINENAPYGLVPFASPDLLAALSEHDGTDPTTEEER